MLADMSPMKSVSENKGVPARRRGGRLVFVMVVCLTVALRARPEPQVSLQRPPAPATPEMQTPKVVGFAPIGDVQMYYEVHGSGDPILFIHGGGGSSRLWTEYVTGLSRDFMVIIADSRGQGNSTDGAGPITFGRIAFDAVRLLDHLCIARAHVVGHSSGGVAGLYLLVHFPDRVKTATLMGTIYHRDNYRPEAYANMKRELEAHLRGEKPEGGAQAREAGFRSRPISVVKKFHSAWLTGPTFTLEVLETISRPTLIVKAGRDNFMAPEVTDAMHAHIKGSELISFPDATHRVPRTNSAELIPAIRDFIARRGKE